MEMTYDGTLVLPKNHVIMSEEEMTYVEGGGTFSITISKNTICTAIGLAGGVATKAALTAVFSSMMVGVATAIELGTAGWGTLLAGLVLYYGSGVAAAAAGAIVRKVSGNVYRGGDIKLKVVSGSAVPDFNWRM